jgi:hypothetical protein
MCCHSESMTNLFYVRFQVFTALSMKMRAFWDIALCSLVGIDWCFRGAYCLHHQGSGSSPWWWRQYAPLKHWSTQTWHYIPQGFIFKLVLECRDKCTLTILSTSNSGSKNEVTEVSSRYPNIHCTMKPNVVLDYSKHMGGVDCSDHYCLLLVYEENKKVLQPLVHEKSPLAEECRRLSEADHPVAHPPLLREIY